MSGVPSPESALVWETALAEHPTGSVDVVDRGLDAGELRRAEEGEVTGLRQQRADRQGRRPP